MPQHGNGGGLDEISQRWGRGHTWFSSSLVKKTFFSNTVRKERLYHVWVLRNVLGNQNCHFFWELPAHGFLPNTRNVLPWGVQRQSILHEASGEPECISCDKRRRDDDPWHNLFECPAFQLYWGGLMTTLQEMSWTASYTGQFDPSYKKGQRWDQVPAFVTLTMHHMMQLVRGAAGATRKPTSFCRFKKFLI